MTAPIRVLVVAPADEERRIAAFLDRLEPGFETVTTTDERLDDVDLATVDCVVSEHDPDRLRALTVFEAVRTHDSALPFVVFTGRGSEELASRALSAGVTDYLRNTGETEQDERLAHRIEELSRKREHERELDEIRGQYHHLVEQNLVGIYVIQDGRFEYVNQKFADIFGYTRERIISSLTPGDLVTDEDRSSVEALLEARQAGKIESTQYGFSGRRQDGESVEVEVHGSRVVTEGEPAIIGTLIEVTSDHYRERGISALDEATQELMRAKGHDAVADVAVGHAQRILGLTMTGVHLDDGNGRLRPRAWTDRLGEIVNDPPPTYTDDDRFVWEAYQSRELRVVQDTDELETETPVGSVIVASLGSHGVLITSSVRQRDFDHTAIRLVKLLAANVEAALDRADREEQLNQLHVATRRLMTAPTEREIADIATETARNVLGLTLNSIHLRSADTARLDPVSSTSEAHEVFESLPSFDRGSSVAWRAYESGTPAVYDDVRRDDAAFNPDTRIRSELVLPLGDHGVFLAGSTVASEFDDALVSLARVFAANVEAALDRADREKRLVSRERELSRQNDRLDEFVAVVSHDLRNPLSVAEGRLELAREESESDHLDSVSDAHDRMRRLIDDLLKLAKQGRHIGELEPVDLRLVVTEAWSAVSGGTLDVPDDLGTVEADPSRLRELLQNLFGNSVEHGSTNNRPGTDGRADLGSTDARRVPDDGDDNGAGDSSVTVRVGRLDDGAGFFVEDDGPGIDPQNREIVFDYGYTTNELGTGFGLAIVRSIVEAHGWVIELTESDAGGTRFEVFTNE